MPGEFCKSRIVHNRLSSQLLARLLDLRGWNELKLAEVSGILPSVVSGHLSGKNPIRPKHLAAYLRVLDRQERVAFLYAWLRDNFGQEVIANLLDGTKTDSVPSIQENQCRMLDWWATAITRDLKFTKIFNRFSAKGRFKFPLVLLLPVSTAAAQFQGWLLKKACSALYLARSLCSCFEHAAVGVVMLVLALFQQGKVTPQAGEFAEQASELAERTFATSLVATSFLTPALAETTDFRFDSGDTSPPSPDTRKGKVVSRGIANGGPYRAQPRYRINSALRRQRTIAHEWRRLVEARKSVHSGLARLFRDPYPQRSKQKSRKHY
jgi:hypothetical protein